MDPLFSAAKSEMLSIIYKDNMVNTHVIIGILSLLMALTAGCLEERTSELESQTFPILEGPYLGQTSPGLELKIFAPGIVSTSNIESCCSFSPNGKTFVFGYGGSPWGIAFMEEVNGIWTEPQVAPFSGHYLDFDFAFSPVGDKFFFSSYRNSPEDGTTNIWVADRTAIGWSEARNVGSPINSAANDHHPSITITGTLYFFSDRPGGFGGGDIYRSRFEDGKYQKPENLGLNINTSAGEWDVCISPDEDYLIFMAKRPGGYGDYDLYISFRTVEDTWTKAVNMGPKINSAKSEVDPSITSDGKYIFFASKRAKPDAYPPIKLAYKTPLKLEPVASDDNYDIYWVDSQIVEQYRLR